MSSTVHLIISSLSCFHAYQETGATKVLQQKLHYLICQQLKCNTSISNSGMAEIKLQFVPLAWP